MKALGVSLTVEDYSYRLPYWFIHDVLVYESVMDEWKRAHASD